MEKWEESKNNSNKTWFNSNSSTHPTQSIKYHIFAFDGHDASLFIDPNNIINNLRISSHKSSQNP